MITLFLFHIYLPETYADILDSYECYHVIQGAMTLKTIP